MRIKAWHSQYATLKKWIKSETINNGNLAKNQMQKVTMVIISKTYHYYSSDFLSMYAFNH